MVRTAAAAVKRDKRDARKGKGNPADGTWCAFDCDEHPDLADAMIQAHDNGIGVAFTNPCLELWFILHYESQTASLTRHAAQSRSEELLGCKKSLPNDVLEALIERFDGAADRAGDLRVKHEQDGSPAGSNPSSSMPDLINTIKLS